MANIRIQDLQENTDPVADDVAMIDGVATRKVTLRNLVDAGRPFASQAEAEAGDSADTGMSPLTTKQAVDAQRPAGTAGLAVLASEDNPAVFDALGLGSVATQDGYAVPAGGTTGQVLAKSADTDGSLGWTAAGTGDMQASANLSDVEDAAAALANIGGMGLSTYDPDGWGGRVFPYASRALASAANVPAPVLKLSLIHNGRLLDYVRDAAGTALTTADGGTWSPAGISTIYHFGGILDGIADDTEAFKSFLLDITARGTTTANVGSGTARVSEQLTFPPISYEGGSLTLDFSAVASGLLFPNDACVFSYGGDVEALPGLASDVVKGAHEVVFATAPALSPGDLFCIFNPTDFSLNGWRSYYKAGEWCRVLDVSDTTVTLTAPLNADYAVTDVDIYIYPDSSINLSGVGRLKVIGSTAVSAGALFHRLQKSCFDRLEVFGSADTEIRWYECVDCWGGGLYTGKGDLNLVSYYGGYVANCQGMNLNGRWAGGRHGLTLTGTGSAGFITPPNRDCHITGGFFNMPNSADAYHSANAHGNSLDYSFSGYFHNGFSFGGQRGRVAGKVETFSINEYGAIGASELHGTEFLFDVDIETTSNPANLSRGVIDVGGNSQALDGNLIEGGIIRIRGTLKAPNASRLIRIRNRGATGLYMGVDISGLRIVEASGSGASSSIQVDAVSGDVFTDLWLDGFQMPSGHGWSAATVTAIHGWRQAIKSSITTSTASNVATTSVAFSAPKTPAIMLGLGDISPGNNTDVMFAFANATLSPLGVDLVLRRDGGNFNTVESIPVHLYAVVDEPS